MNVLVQTDAIGILYRVDMVITTLQSLFTKVDYINRSNPIKTTMLMSVIWFEYSQRCDHDRVHE